MISKLSNTMSATVLGFVDLINLKKWVKLSFLPALIPSYVWSVRHIFFFQSVLSTLRLSLTAFYRLSINLGGACQIISHSQNSSMRSTAWATKVKPVSLYNPGRSYHLLCGTVFATGGALNSFTKSPLIDLNTRIISSHTHLDFD